MRTRHTKVAIFPRPQLFPDLGEVWQESGRTPEWSWAFGAPTRGLRPWQSRHNDKGRIDKQFIGCQLSVVSGKYSLQWTRDSLPPFSLPQLALYDSAGESDTMNARSRQHNKGGLPASVSADRRPTTRSTLRICDASGRTLCWPPSIPGSFWATAFETLNPPQRDRSNPSWF